MYSEIANLTRHEVFLQPAFIFTIQCGNFDELEDDQVYGGFMKEKFFFSLSSWKTAQKARPFHNFTHFFLINKKV